MPTTETLFIFLIAALLLNLSPGPSNFYVMSRSIAQGKASGYVAAMGLALGSLVHVVAAALGIAAVFAYSPVAYTLLKLLGAGYLIYLGLCMFLSDDIDNLPVGSIEPKRYSRILWESAIVEVTNPKTALFFLAFLPQFVDVSLGTPALQLLVLGAIVTLSAIPCDLFVAYGSGNAARWMAGKFNFLKFQNRISGSILLGLGTYMALDSKEDWAS